MSFGLCLQINLCESVGVTSALLLGINFVQESLRFRLQGTVGDIGSWGHEYVRFVLIIASHKGKRGMYGDVT